MKFLVQQQPAFVYTGGKPFDAAKPSIIFIHGAAADHSVWTLQSRYFAHHGFNALTIDLPGHGKSFGDAKTTISQYADWVINLSDHGAIREAVVVGHSMGSLIALDLATRYSTRVSRLALLGCNTPMPVADALMDAAEHCPHEAFDMLNIWGHAPQVKWNQSAIPGTALMMAYKCLLEKSRPGVLANDLTACSSFALAADTMKQIVAPTLVLSGSKDMMSPPKAAQLVATQIIGATFSLLDGVGHAMMQEAPGKVLDALRDFIKPI